MDSFFSSSLGVDVYEEKKGLPKSPPPGVADSNQTPK